MIIEPYEANSYKTQSVLYNNLNQQTYSGVTTSNVVLTNYSPGYVFTDYTLYNPELQTYSSEVSVLNGRVVSNTSSVLSYESTTEKEVLPPNYIPPITPKSLQEPDAGPKTYEYRSSDTSPNNVSIYKNNNILIFFFGILIIFILFLIIFYFVL
jgi:hypothetical protein